MLSRTVSVPSPEAGSLNSGVDIKDGNVSNFNRELYSMLERVDRSGKYLHERFCFSRKLLYNINICL